MVPKTVCWTYCALVLAVCVCCSTLSRSTGGGDSDVAAEKTNDTNCVYEGYTIKFEHAIFSSAGECFGVYCTHNKTTVQLRCGIPEIHKMCYGQFYNFKKPFPKCCPREVCPGETGKR